VSDNEPPQVPPAPGWAAPAGPPPGDQPPTAAYPPAGAVPPGQVPPGQAPPNQYPPQPQPGGDYPGKTLGIVGLILAFVASLIGVIVSAVALVQSRRAGRKNGPALAGIIVGSVLTVIGFIVSIVLILALVNAAAQQADGPLPQPTGDEQVQPTADPQPTQEPDDQSDVFLLTVGDCFNDPNVDEIFDVPIVDCSEPHDYEVFGEFDLEGDAFPGEDALFAQADEGCLAAFQPYIGVPFEQSTLSFSYYVPTEQSWISGDRLVSCLVYDEAGQTTGSLAGAAR